MGAAWDAAGVMVVAAICLLAAILMLLLPARDSHGERELGGYRLRRVTRRRWTVERFWDGDWRPLAPPASRDVAQAYWRELTAWEAHAARTATERHGGAAVTDYARTVPFGRYGAAGTRR